MIQCFADLLATCLILEVVRLVIHLKEIEAAAGRSLLVTVDAADHILHAAAVKGLIPVPALRHTIDVVVPTLLTTTETGRAGVIAPTLLITTVKGRADVIVPTLRTTEKGRADVIDPTLLITTEEGRVDVTAPTLLTTTETTRLMSATTVEAGLMSATIVKADTG